MPVVVSGSTSNVSSASDGSQQIGSGVNVTAAGSFAVEICVWFESWGSVTDGLELRCDELLYLGNRCCACIMRLCNEDSDTESGSSRKDRSELRNDRQLPTLDLSADISCWDIYVLNR